MANGIAGQPPSAGFKANEYDRPGPGPDTKPSTGNTPANPPGGSGNTGGSGSGSPGVAGGSQGNTTASKGAQNREVGDKERPTKNNDAKPKEVEVKDVNKGKTSSEAINARSQTTKNADASVSRQDPRNQVSGKQHDSAPGYGQNKQLENESLTAGKKQDPLRELKQQTADLLKLTADYQGRPPKDKLRQFTTKELGISAPATGEYSSSRSSKTVSITAKNATTKTDIQIQDNSKGGKIELSYRGRTVDLVKNTTKAEIKGTVSYEPKLSGGNYELSPNNANKEQDASDANGANVTPRAGDVVIPFHVGVGGDNVVPAGNRSRDTAPKAADPKMRQGTPEKEQRANNASPLRSTPEKADKSGAFEDPKSHKDSPEQPVELGTGMFPRGKSRFHLLPPSQLDVSPPTTPSETRPAPPYSSGTSLEERLASDLPLERPLIDPLDILGFTVAGSLIKLAGKLVSRGVVSGGLVHLTDSAAGAGISKTGTLIGGRSGVYAGPISNASARGLGVTLRTGLSPGKFTTAVRIPALGEGAFSSVAPVGPFTFWQGLTGQAYTAAGALDLTTGAFVRTGVNWNQAVINALDPALGSAVINTLQEELP